MEAKKGAGKKGSGKADWGFAPIPSKSALGIKTLSLL